MTTIGTPGRRSGSEGAAANPPPPAGDSRADLRSKMNKTGLPVSKAVQQSMPSPLRKKKELPWITKKYRKYQARKLRERMRAAAEAEAQASASPVAPPTDGTKW